MTFFITTPSPEKTGEFAEKLAAFLQPGDVLCLSGDLGRGKTLFAQGIAAGLKVAEPVTSPTFSLLNIYAGELRGKALEIYHFDLYRLEEKRELENIGFEEYIFSDGITIIEWPDKFLGSLPDEYLFIKIEADESRGENFRNITLIPSGQRYEELCGELNL